MTAAAFSADGSVLAVAADTVITLWDPEYNVLVAVLGEIQTVKMLISLSFLRFEASLQNFQPQHFLFVVRACMQCVLSFLCNYLVRLFSSIVSVFAANYVSILCGRVRLSCNRFKTTTINM